jgi:hypothetical protein
VVDKAGTSPLIKLLNDPYVENSVVEVTDEVVVAVYGFPNMKRGPNVLVSAAVVGTTSGLTLVVPRLIT